jgi:hypothetical protein
MPRVSSGGPALRLAAVLLPLLACAQLRGAGPVPGGSRGWDYEVAALPGLGRLDVKLCFHDRIPRELVADEGGAASYLVAPRALADGRALAVDAEAETIDTTGATGKCIAYGVDLARILEEVDERPAVRVSGVVATSPHLWLWRPARLYEESQVSLRFALPAGVSASVPWPEQAPGRYRLSSTAFTWASQVVLGELHELRFTAAGAEFRVAVMDREREISDAGVRRWLDVAATTVASLYDGKFPVPHMQVIVVPYRGGGDPVYFGMALRGGGPAVQLLISSAAEDREFPGEWVAIHEFLHHGMPFVDKAEAWLSEGFVTYYTEVLRARAGFRSEQHAWSALLAGFDRGGRSGAGQSLADESRQMHDNHAYQRVYWGGAAIALLADVALREAGSSLDAAMRRLRRCCAATLRIWTAAQVLQAMDRRDGPTAYPQLGALSGPILRSAAFPELTPIYRKLGVSMVNGEPTLDESAPFAHIRRAIFSQPRP